MHVSKLNDPFDPYCFFETDFQGKYQNLPMHVRKNHPSDMPWFRAHVTPQNWGNAVNDLETHLQNVRETAFVLSTSAANSGIHPKENLYMWGHYASGHREHILWACYRAGRNRETGNRCQTEFPHGNDLSRA